MKFVPTTPDPPIGLAAAPPPWTLKVAQSWILTTTLLPASADGDSGSAGVNPNNTPAILQGLPAGAYPPFEAVHPSAVEDVGGKPQRVGVTASVCIIRYADSSVGPYDELIFMPGGFRNPAGDDVASRVSAIYVDSESSVWNGRRNWNMAKHLAHFEWTPAGPRRMLLKVYHHADAPAPFSTTSPFFTALLSTPRFAGMYVPPALLGKRSRMIQPPLLAGSGPLAIATADGNPWLAIAPRYHGRWGVGYAEPVPDEQGGLASFGDGVAFPKVVLKSRRGVTFKGKLVFPEAHVIGKKA